MLPSYTVECTLDIKTSGSKPSALHYSKYNYIQQQVDKDVTSLHMTCVTLTNNRLEPTK